MKIFKPKEIQHVCSAYPNGHFYSPVVDVTTLIDRAKDIWNSEPDIKGIDFNETSHKCVLEKLFSKHIKNYTYVETFEEVQSDIQFYTQNSQFSWLDSRLLFVLLNEWKPQKMIEVGSGFSSLLSANVNHKFLGNSMDFKCIEPYPREFLKQPISGLNEVIIDKVENIPLSLFESLNAGDILFIDSSHVSKTGSDVNFLFFEILPILKKGVRIHIHDIFLPFDYPEAWVLQENRSWNEQYLLRALLMHSTTFKILFGCSFAQYKFPELVIQALNHPKKNGFGGGSLWIEKIA